MKDRHEELYGMQACYEAIEIELKCGNKNIFELLGRYIARNEQDRWFNPTMIQAAKKYIADHNIGWDD